ncbi:MAG: YHS domain-containing (seleno)protein [Pseudomonadota bacterium]
MTVSRRTALRLALLAPLAAAALPARGFAGQDPVFTEFGLAIRGADPVAYFTERHPVEGLESFRHRWNGATWQFASAENRDLFAADPTAFAPQYGGWCAFALARGVIAPTDPTAWAVVDGRLYLNFNRATQRRWERDIPGNIVKANSNWAEALG